MEDPVARLPCGVVVLDSESMVLSINAFCCELLGYEATEIIGKRIDILLNVPSRIYFQTHIYPLITLRNIASELYLNLQTRQRKVIPVQINANRQEHTGEPRVYLTFLPVHQRRQFEQDILAAKKAAEDALFRNDELLALQQTLEQHQTDLDRQLGHLRQRNDELEQFSKIISHDLQEPLRKINIFAGLLSVEKTDSLSAMGNMALTGIDKASGKLRQLIADLQLYFTLTNKATNPDPVDLNTLMQAVASEYAAPGLAFDVQPLPIVLGDRVSLTSLFRNLIDNAVKFQKSDLQPVIHINSTIVGYNSFRRTPDKYKYVDYARITISDNGIGFDNNYRDEIFQLLKKLHPHTPGMGLGLAMSKKIVDWHNGQITAESTVGKGTKITVLLPVA